MCRWYCPNRGGRVGSRRPLEPSEVVPPGAFFMSSCGGGSWGGPGWGSKGRGSYQPPALPVGKGAGRCAPMLPRRLFPRVFYVFVRWWFVAWSGSRLQGAGVVSGLFCCRASGVFGVVLFAGGLLWCAGRLRSGSSCVFRLSVPAHPVSVTPLWSVRNDITMCFRPF